MLQELDLSDRSILVAGGSSGIGLKAIGEFARYGARAIFMGATSMESYDAALQKLSKREGLDLVSLPIYPFVANVAEREQIATRAIEVKRNGLAVTDVISSQGAGMQRFSRSLFEQHIFPIKALMRKTPLEELSADTRSLVEEKLEAMRRDLRVWTEDSLEDATAVNAQGTTNVLEVMGDTFPSFKRHIAINSTWGQVCGEEGMEIPLIYGAVGRSKEVLKKNFRQLGPEMASQGRYLAMVIATLVNDTNVGKMFNDSFLILMDSDQRQAVKESSVQSLDVVGAIETLLLDDPTQWETYPNELYVYKNDGLVVVEKSLPLSKMYTKPYRF